MIIKTLGKFNLFIGTVALLLLSSCMLSKSIMDENSMEDSSKSIKYLALGDSYTIGEGAEESERWPVQLGTKLEEEGFDVQKLDIIAQTGWTTMDLLLAMENEDLDDYNLVSLLIGVNNQYQSLSFETFKTEFDILLQKSIDIAGSKEKVFVVSIPDYGLTPFGKENSELIAKEIDKYNTYISGACKDQDIPFINVTDISRKLGASSGALMSDKLHPSALQYKEWVDEILPVVMSISKSK